jgi:formylglycine-generating enzyme required for sulfatase activity
LLKETTGPEHVAVITEALADRPEVTRRLWDVLANNRAPAGQRLRAACALASYDPKDGRWEKVREDVVRKLVAENLQVLPQWAGLLRPVRGRLVDLVVERLAAADAVQYPPLLLLCQAYRPEALTLLKGELDRKPAAQASAEDRHKLWQRQAQVAATLLQLGEPARVWPLLRHSNDPTRRTYLIHRLAPLRVAPQTLVQRLKDKPEVSERRALLLALGEIPPDQVNQAEQQELVQQWLHVYRDDPDPGIHSAVEWLLRRWKLGQDPLRKIDAELQSTKPNGSRRWYVNGQGQTMVLVAKPRQGVFWMGGGNQRHPQRLGHNFAISSQDVTVEQFQRFRAEYKPSQWAPRKDCPVIEVSWFDAAQYCNWLSKREGIAEAQWCYEPNKEGKYAEGMKIKAGYLRLKGYRLPTEAEWEYACRAGSTVGYSFGEPAELLERYGWFDRNSLVKTHPGGTLKPNDLGLFDMHGNVWQWTNDLYNDKPIEIVAEGAELIGASYRVYRGGGWSDGAGLCRAAYRNGFTPDYRGIALGFRLARAPQVERMLCPTEPTAFPVPLPSMGSGQIVTLRPSSAGSKREGSGRSFFA